MLFIECLNAEALGQVEAAISLNHSLLAPMAAVRCVCCRLGCQF